MSVLLHQGTDSAAEVLLAEKIKLLLLVGSSEHGLLHPQQQERPTRHQDESRLIALILLTRISNQLFENLRQDLLNTHSDFWGWIIRLIKDPCKMAPPDRVTSSTEHRLRDAYVRFAAILLERITNSDRSFAGTLVVAMSNFLEQRRTLSLSLVDLEVIAALRGWVSSFSKHRSEDKRHSIVWWGACLAATERWLGSLRPQMLQVSSEHRGDETHAEELMAETLERILNSGEKGTDDVTKAFAEEITELLILCWSTTSGEADNKIPSFFKTMLDFWIKLNRKNEIDADNRRAMTRVLLFYVKHMAHLEVFKDALQHTLSQNVIQLILTCVVSNQKDNDVRAAAWSTLTTLLETNGWEWLLIGPASSKSQSTICSVSRLAVGEWRIQLGLVLAEEGSSPTDSCLLLLQACGQVILQVLHLMVNLAEQFDDDNVSFSGEAILRVRSSLEESLNGAVQYIGCSQHRHKLVDKVVVRVFSTLLTEFDVFEQQRHTRDFEHPKDYIQENDALQALKQAVSYRDVGVTEELLPALAAVFASSEGDSTRVAQLEQYGLLGNEISCFFQLYWRETQNLGSMSLASEVVELWFAISQHDGLLELKRAILSGIEKIMSSQANSETSALSLSAAFSCYVTLQGDSPPTDSAARTIQRAAMLLGHD